MKRLLAALLIFANLACSPPESAAARPERQTAVAIVKNVNWSMMRVYVFEGSSPVPYRICTVESETTARCVVRLRAGTPVRFMYSPLARSADSYITEDVYLLPGDTLRLNIQQYLPFSSIFLSRPQ